MTSVPVARVVRVAVVIVVVVAAIPVPVISPARIPGLAGTPVVGGTVAGLPSAGPARAMPVVGVVRVAVVVVVVVAAIPVPVISPARIPGLAGTPVVVGQRRWSRMGDARRTETRERETGRHCKS